MQKATKRNLLLVCEGVVARLTVEGRDPEDYHVLGIARELHRSTWDDARKMNRWINR